MAHIYASASDGRILRFAVTAEELEILGGAIPSVPILEFDGATNAALIADLSRSLAPFTLVGGILFKYGVPQTINGDGEAESFRKQLAMLIQNERDYLANPSPTQAQTIAAIKGIIRLLLYLIVHRLKLI